MRPPEPLPPKPRGVRPGVRRPVAYAPRRTTSRLPRCGRDRPIRWRSRQLVGRPAIEVHHLDAPTLRLHRIAGPGAAGRGVVAALRRESEPEQLRHLVGGRAPLRRRRSRRASAPAHEASSRRGPAGCRAEGHPQSSVARPLRRSRSARPSRRKIRSVEASGSQPAGAATREMAVTEGATPQAGPSAWRNARRLGASSPTTIERQVTSIATVPKRSGSNTAAGTPRPAPEKTPARSPTSVVPIWTLERKRPGSSDSARAVPGGDDRESR